MILAFAVLFWYAEQPGDWLLLGADDVMWTLLAVLAQPVLFGVAAGLAARRAAALHEQAPDNSDAVQRTHHRLTIFLRIAVFVGFAATVQFTPWPQWFAFGKVNPALQIVGDLLTLTPFLVNVVVIWAAAYSLERVLRGEVGPEDPAEVHGRQEWSFSSYLDFNIRHHLLVIAVPMTLILFTANLTRGYEAVLQEWTGWVWTPDALLAIVAASVFVVAPVMLRRIWRTAPLEPGPVRDRLEALCNRIGLRFREILVWHSGGLMVNAAVMGIFRPVRYVLLSDALLSTMNQRQIEAVFGHEAGHIRHRHMQHFLVFALVGWLTVAGIMELLARAASTPGATVQLSLLAIEGIGVFATVILWGIGFGWLSRRFERQADLFAARCATPESQDCPFPCSVHPDHGPAVASEGRVCATGAEVFASALIRVAALNGIPAEERSWRHSSIATRVRFLASLAGDPQRVKSFERVIRRVKLVMLVLGGIGLIACVYYWITVPEPAILKLQINR